MAVVAASAARADAWCRCDEQDIMRASNERGRAATLEFEGRERVGRQDTEGRAAMLEFEGRARVATLDFKSRSRGHRSRPHRVTGPGGGRRVRGWRGGPVGE
jgi:hypothetical protein